GIWPPSKPLMATPDRLFWPFWPRPPVLPLPEPMPRPTRVRSLRAPGLSRMSLSFMLMHSLSLSSRGCSIDHFDHMGELGDRAADLRGVLNFDDAVHLPQTETDQGLFVAFGPADRRTDLLDLDLCHVSYSAMASAATSASASLAPPRPNRSATFLPRR